jgi:LPXTG-motif cell wall-anchored protein
LLRSTAYFDGNGGGRPALVLAAWALVGLLLVGLGWLLQRRRTQEPVSEQEQPFQELVLEEPATV